MNRGRILAVATQGAGGDDEARLRLLLSRLPAEFLPFDKCAKIASGRRLYQTICRDRPALVVMEGTGAAGGWALLKARFRTRIPYVFGSGDAVGPFLSAQRPLLKPVFSLYERMLCRFSAGFIGWTPYLAGRALTLGAPRAMTAAGWAPSLRTEGESAESRREMRRRLGIPSDALVFGIVGSLNWAHRSGYCYGLDLVRAARRVRRSDLRILIVGDGDGLPRLKEAAGDRLDQTILFTGRVPRTAVPDYLAAMDVAALPQSVDGVGSFRYTTKLSEYLAAGVPIVTGRIPLAYDLDGGWLWRLPGNAPWHEGYVAALAELMERLTPGQLVERRRAVPRCLPEFDRERQIARVTAFLSDVMESPAE